MKTYKCSECKDTGIVGDNRHGYYGNNEYEPCTNSIHKNRPSIEGETMNTWKDEQRRPCKHSGCYNHVSHPCEMCGRIQGRIPKQLLFDIESLLKEQRGDDLKKIINGLTVFTEKPIGTIEGDLCDWNKPSVFAHNYSPQELQDAVVKRIKEIFNILNAPEPSGVRK